MGDQPQLFKETGLGPPWQVILAIAMLTCLFISGIIYLLITGPFAKIELLGEDVLPLTRVIVLDYEGSIFGMEKARKKIKKELNIQGIEVKEAINIFFDTPLKLRPLSIKCELGYIIPGRYPVENLISNMKSKEIKSGEFMLVKLRGRGNFTGPKVFRAAKKELSSQGIELVSGHRYEVKNNTSQGRTIEHWFPFMRK